MFATRILLALVLSVAVIGGARAACGPFPHSNFIGNYSHSDIAKYVDAKHDGDWAPYLGMLEANLDRLRQLQISGQAATLRVRGEPVRLGTAELMRFIYVSKQWYGVAQCLAEAENVQSLNDFATAAGSSGDPSASSDSLENELPALDSMRETVSHTASKLVDEPDRRRPQSPELASVSDQQLDLKVETSCRNGYTYFKVVNIGDAWPDTGTFSMFRLDGKERQMISARRLAMDSGGEKKFTVSPTQNRTGHVGFSISPSWYSRPFTMDADARCE